MDDILIYIIAHIIKRPANALPLALCNHALYSAFSTNIARLRERSYKLANKARYRDEYNVMLLDTQRSNIDDILCKELSSLPPQEYALAIRHTYLQIGSFCKFCLTLTWYGHCSDYIK